MSSEFLRGLSIHGYGVSLGVGIGVPIPILDEDLMKTAVTTDNDIYAPVLDYSTPSRDRRPIGEVSYAELKSGNVEILGKSIKTSSLSSYNKARVIADKLKNMITNGEFLLTQPVEKLPEERKQKPLNICSKDEVAQ